MRHLFVFLLPQMDAKFATKTKLLERINVLNDHSYLFGEDKKGQVTHKITLITIKLVALLS